jgi:hypothetical protein
LRIFALATRELSPHLDLGDGALTNFARLLGPCLLRPGRLAEFALYGLYRLWGVRRWLGTALMAPRSWGQLAARPLMVVVHRFMGEGELETELGRARLEACVFKLPVDGQMVSMCQVNATQLRRQLNLRRAGRSVASRRG